MAFPNSRWVSFVANTVPVIPAAALNAWQDWIAGITNATVSVLGLDLDGAGGAARTGVAGAVKWWNTAAGGGNPLRTVALKNELRALNVPKVWFFGITDGGGGLSTSDGANVTGFSFPGGNLLQITFAQGFDSDVYCVVPHAKLGNQTLLPSVNRNTSSILLLDFNLADISGGAPAAIDPATQAGIEIHLQIFGRMTTA